MFLNQFQNVGRWLFLRGLVSSSSGNLSIRLGDRLIITRRGSNLGALQEKDLVETGINKNDRSTPLASSELAVHRAIYQNTGEGNCSRSPTPCYRSFHAGKSDQFHSPQRVLRTRSGAGSGLGN